MTKTRQRAVLTQTVDVEAMARFILERQIQTGEIPWHDSGKTDPWDHVEAAMGLAVAGHIEAARRAFYWLSGRQLPDGSWYAAYRNGEPEDRTRDANFSAYIAVGVCHHFLVTSEVSFVKAMWPTVEKGVDFAVSLQAPGGEIHWAKDPEGRVDPMALLTGSSAIFMSLKCAILLARDLGLEKPEWKAALARLGQAILHEPHRFNVTKARFSMDWFYPILCGAVTREAARQRIERSWKKFVVEGEGVRCVSDQPWITIAETSELVLTLCAMGNRGQAEVVYNWISEKKYPDGAFWCGHTFPDRVIWPEEKMTWTNGVFLLATDALYSLTPGRRLFDHRFWEDQGIF
jgi:hypothetical protein